MYSYDETFGAVYKLPIDAILPGFCCTNNLLQ